MKCECGVFVPKAAAVKKVRDGHYIKVCQKCAEKMIHTKEEKKDEKGS